MSDQQAIQRFADVFRSHIEANLGAAIQTALAEQRRAEEAMFRRMKDCNMSGFSWPSCGYSVTLNRYFLHFNIPSWVATERNRALVEDARAAAEEATGLRLDGDRVRGGSNFVIDGRIVPKPEPDPETEEAVATLHT